ncbi:hypothetical protein V6N11_071458 [Hibiscus sabdariffa]|uniref:Uncharacterized protein n=1 Tax=Hibiscus sabdariffa TaxID=183260 RepID=A0ABR2U050_9ROSI
MIQQLPSWSFYRSTCLVLAYQTPPLSPDYWIEDDSIGTWWILTLVAWHCKSSPNGIILYPIILEKQADSGFICSAPPFKLENYYNMMMMMILSQLRFNLYIC